MCYIVAMKVIIRFWATKDERQLAEGLAKNLGLSLSSFMRYLIHKADDKRTNETEAGAVTGEPN